MDGQQMLGQTLTVLLGPIAGCAERLTPSRIDAGGLRAPSGDPFRGHVSYMPTAPARQGCEPVSDPLSVDARELACPMLSSSIWRFVRASLSGFQGCQAVFEGLVTLPPGRHLANHRSRPQQFACGIA